MFSSIKCEPAHDNGGNAIVYVIQEIPGTKAGTPKINIMSASKYGNVVEQILFCLLYGDGYG